MAAMKYVEVIAEQGLVDTVAAIAEDYASIDCYADAPGVDGRQVLRLLVADDKLQPVLDILQRLLVAQPTARIIVLPVEIALPRQDDARRKVEDAAIAAREFLYDNVERNARLDGNFVLLVILSTAVAAIGLIEDNVAVVIGAMVIAPLLGPILAFGLGTALGDLALMRKSALTAGVGIGLAAGLAALIGLCWRFEAPGVELAARSEVGLESVALALAAGAAAVLSLTTGLSSVLVGVMVAVALLPPAATVGLMLSHGAFGQAAGAALLLATNVACINLAANAVFFAKGIRPRTWGERAKARRALRAYAAVWVVTLLVLVACIVVLAR